MSRYGALAISGHPHFGLVVNLSHWAAIGATVAPRWECLNVAFGGDADATPERMAETQRIYVVVERKSLLSRSENGRNTLDMYQECEIVDCAPPSMGFVVASRS